MPEEFLPTLSTTSVGDSTARWVLQGPPAGKRGLWQQRGDGIRIAVIFAGAVEDRPYPSGAGPTRGQNRHARDPNPRRSADRQDALYCAGFVLFPRYAAASLSNGGHFPPEPAEPWAVPPSRVPS